MHACYRAASGAERHAWAAAALAWVREQRRREACMGVMHGQLQRWQGCESSGASPAAWRTRKSAAVSGAAPCPRTCGRPGTTLTRASLHAALPGSPAFMRCSCMQRSASLMNECPRRSTKLMRAQQQRARARSSHAWNARHARCRVATLLQATPLQAQQHPSAGNSRSALTDTQYTESALRVR
jgi:hypothetical protein